MTRAMLVLCFASATASAQFASFSVVDPCGVRPAWVGSNMLIEDSPGFCNVPISSFVTSMTGPTEIVLPTSFNTGIETNDKLYITGVSGGLPSINGAWNATYVSNNTFALQGSTYSGGTYSGGMVTVLFQKPDSVSKFNPRYDLKLLTNSGGSWSITNLTTGPVRAALGISGDCSIGNPDGYSDGTNTYIAFTVQDNFTDSLSQPNCQDLSAAGGQSPGGGGFYDLWACNLDAGTTLSTGNCHVLITSSQMSGNQAGAFLDPHIWHNGNVYASERAGTSTTYPSWSIDEVTLSWGTPPTTAPSFTAVSRYQFGTWAAPRPADNCEQFYKLTSLFDLPSGRVRGFFNANQVGNSYAGAGAGCPELGAGGFGFDGTFYGDFNGTLSGAGTIHQIYPPYNTSNLNYPDTATCVTPNGNIQCYSEFPYIFRDGTRMILSGGLFTQSWVIDSCAANSPCQPNFNNEEIQAQISTDFTSAMLPMTILAMSRRTNYNVLGSQACSQFLSPNNSPLCGIAYGYYGGCSHLSIDEPSVQLACSFATNIQDANGNPMNQVVLSPLITPPLTPGVNSLLNPAAQLTGAVQVSGGVTIAPQ